MIWLRTAIVVFGILLFVATPIAGFLFGLGYLARASIGNK